MTPILEDAIHSGSAAEESVICMYTWPSFFVPAFVVKDGTVIGKPLHPTSSLFLLWAYRNEVTAGHKIESEFGPSIDFESFLMG